MSLFQWLRWIFTGKTPMVEKEIHCFMCGSEWVGMRWVTKDGKITDIQQHICNNCGNWWERKENA